MIEKEDFIKKILSKEYFILYPWMKNVHNWEYIKNYLINSDFMEYVFFLILSSKYDILSIEWTQFDKKDFRINEKLSFEYENSGDLLLSNFDTIKNLRNISPTKYKNNIWFFNTPLRKFTPENKTYIVNNLEKPYIENFINQQKTIIKELEGTIDNNVFKTITQNIVITDTDYIEKAKDILKTNINQCIKRWNNDLIIKTYINKNVSKAIYYFFNKNKDLWKFLFLSYKDYINVRNSKLNINTTFKEYLSKIYGNIDTYIDLLKTMFKDVEYTQKTFDTKWKPILKKYKWIETYYINKKNLNIENIDKLVYILYNLPKGKELLYTNSFISFDKSLIKKLSIKNLTFN